MINDRNNSRINDQRKKNVAMGEKVCYCDFVAALVR